ncbi:hypothetical protein ACSQ67_018975 [Phaseolus vulgaris]
MFHRHGSYEGQQRELGQILLNGPSTLQWLCHHHPHHLQKPLIPSRAVQLKVDGNNVCACPESEQTDTLCLQRDQNKKGNEACDNIW